MKRIAILQSNYIPWKGYFDLIAASNEFILYDEVQYTKNDWRNRNKVKTPRGLEWITIPVKHHFGQRIDEAVISNSAWQKSHWSILAQNYGKAPYFKLYANQLKALYQKATDISLSNINRLFIEEMCGILEIHTKITWSTDYTISGDKTERLIELCKASGASHYLSGPSARNYLREDLFKDAGIILEYMDYSGYPEYLQMHGAFEHGVSIIDLIFNTGPDARAYMKYTGK